MVRSQNVALRTRRWKANLVECIVDLSELSWCELTRVDALDLATKVDKVRGIRGSRQRQRGQFDGHSWAGGWFTVRLGINQCDGLRTRYGDLTER